MRYQLTQNYLFELKKNNYGYHYDPDEDEIEFDDFLGTGGWCEIHYTSKVTDLYANIKRWVSEYNADARFKCWIEQYYAGNRTISPDEATQIFYYSDTVARSAHHSIPEWLMVLELTTRIADARDELLEVGKTPKESKTMKKLSEAFLGELDLYNVSYEYSPETGKFVAHGIDANLCSEDRYYPATPNLDQSLYETTVDDSFVDNIEKLCDKYDPEQKYRYWYLKYIDEGFSYACNPNSQEELIYVLWAIATDCEECENLYEEIYTNTKRRSNQ